MMVLNKKKIFPEFFHHSSVFFFFVYFLTWVCVRTKSSFILEYFIGLVSFSSPPHNTTQQIFFSSCWWRWIILFWWEELHLRQFSNGSGFVFYDLPTWFFFFFVSSPTELLFILTYPIYLFVFLHIFSFCYFLLIFSCIYFPPFHFLVPSHITSWAKIYVCHICAST